MDAAGRTSGAAGEPRLMSTVGTRAPATVVIGGSGVVGRAVVEALGPHAIAVARCEVPGTVAVDGHDVPRMTAFLRAARAHTVICAAGRRTGSPGELMRDNAELAERIAAACCAARVQRLVAIGSAAEVEGADPRTRIPEQTPVAPRSSYGASKAAAWAAVRRVISAQAGRLGERVPELCWARVFNVVSSREAVGVAGELAIKALALGADDTRFVLHNAAVVRDFALIEDVAGAIAALARSPRLPAVVNVCSGQGMSLGQLATRMTRARGLRATIISRATAPASAVVGDDALLLQIAGRSLRSPVEVLAHAALAGAARRSVA
jgi:nucleoside-diphosphate-sugar epimerase